MTVPALALAGRGLVDPAQPAVRADDLGVQRGDGLFETVRVVAGRPVKLGLHLRRMRAGAGRMDLALPDDGEWRELAATAVAASGAGDGLLKLVCTRGPAAGGPPTAFALVLPIPPEVVAGRVAGVRAVTLTLGIAAEARERAPWLLGGVKTTSYAVHMASLREAAARGAEDAIWLALGGEVLEAPTSTVCWVAGGTVRTPPATTGVLEGTTTVLLRAVAAELGVPFAVAPGTVADLRAADEILLVSSIRGVAGVRELDGRPVGSGALGRLTVRLRDAVEDHVAGRMPLAGLED